MIKRYKAIASVLGLVALFGFGWTEPVHANPSTFAISTSTSAATTSPTFMTIGNSTTTTPVYDAYAQTLSGGQTFKADFAGLLVQLTATSSATVLTGCPEYSQDGVDWYRDFLTDPMQMGTTSPTTALTSPFCFTWKFASSSVGGAAPLANSNRATAALNIPTPFRYTRVWFAVSGANGAVWAQLIPIRERP